MPSKGWSICGADLIGLWVPRVKLLLTLIKEFTFNCSIRGCNNLKSICKNNNIIGDISDISQAKEALECGCIALATSLSGYTPKCNVDMDSPNFKLLEDLIKEYPQTPIIAEGRFWERGQVKRAFDIGAHNVVVGTAITRPHLTVMRLRGY